MEGVAIGRVRVGNRGSPTSGSCRETSRPCTLLAGLNTSPLSLKHPCLFNSMVRSSCYRPLSLGSSSCVTRDGYRPLRKCHLPLRYHCGRQRDQPQFTYGLLYSDNKLSKATHTLTLTAHASGTNPFSFDRADVQLTDA